jgi:large subunit ribosomal protein L25
MSATKVLKAEARPRAGKGAARALRREGRIPAVIYGEKQPALGISLDGNQMSLLLHGGGFMTTVFEVQVDGATERAIPRDFQLDPVRDTLMHIDFLRVGKDSVISVDVPVHFLNEDKSPGLKRGGVLNVVRHTVELYVPADAIPDSLEADLTGLDINDALHISAIKLPDRVTPVITDRDFTVATIAAPTVVTEAAAADETAGEATTPGS